MSIPRIFHFEVIGFEVTGKTGWCIGGNRKIVFDTNEVTYSTTSTTYNIYLGNTYMVYMVYRVYRVYQKF